MPKMYELDITIHLQLDHEFFSKYSGVVYYFRY